MTIAYLFLEVESSQLLKIMTEQLKNTSQSLILQLSQSHQIPSPLNQLSSLTYQLPNLNSHGQQEAASKHKTTATYTEPSDKCKDHANSKNICCYFNTDGVTFLTATRERQMHTDDPSLSDEDDGPHNNDDDEYTHLNPE